MKRVGYSLLATVAALLVANVAYGQTTFTLGFTGGSSFSGNEGDAWKGSCACTLARSPEGDAAAQGWSLSLTATNATLTGITVAGTLAAPVPDGLFNGGFEKSELTGPVGPGRCPGGVDGAVSAVVLSFTLPIVLTPTPAAIAAVTVEGTIPAGGGTASLQYVDNCRGSGQPVQNAVTQEGGTVVPVLGSKQITLIQVKSCCNDRVNVGFSGDKVSSANAYDGIADDGAGLCSGGGGEIVTEVAGGATGNRHVFANISSNGAGEGVQGWSFSIALNGDIEFGAGGAKTGGTPGVDNNFSGGFEKTELIDPAKNAGQRGAVSAVVLSFTLPKVLAPTGTESILDLETQANGPQGDADIVGEVKFQGGLRGSGQPVQNALTVGGGTENACNVDTAQVDVIFRKIQAQSFIRGNANNDGKVNIADPIWIINELFKAGPATACSDAADANNDGMEDLADATYLITHQFAGGPAPSAPYPDCGFDAEGTVETCAATQDACR